MNSTILDCIIEPFAECLTIDAAKKIVAFRANVELQQRVDELAVRANLGQLTANERAEYDRYLAAFHFVTAMQARAHRLINS